MCHRLSSKLLRALSAVAFLAAHAASASISDPAILRAVEKSAGAQLSVVWSTPSYLYQDFSLTPVVEAGLASFQAAGGVGVGAMLVLLTEVSAQNPSGLYPHDYRVCASVHADSLLSLTPFRAEGGQFLMMEMQQPAVHEFAATLQVREDSGSYVVDSQIFSTLYASGLPGKHYTFEVWSNAAATTQALVRRLLAGLAASKRLVLQNTQPRPVPVAWVRQISLIGDQVLLDVEAPQAVSGLDVAVVSWEYPNPTPTVTHAPLTIPVTRFLSLQPVTSSTTDVQVFLGYQGILQDEVLTSFNAWGPLTSGWFQFADASGSAARIVRSPLSGLPPYLGEVVMNGSAVGLSGNLVAGGFIGMYVDVLPALQSPGDFQAYDRFIVRAYQTSRLAALPVQMKLELDDGTSRSTMISVGQSWTVQEVPVSRFGNWQALSRHLRRVTFAVTAAPGAVLLNVDRLSLRAKGPERAP